MSWVFFTPQLLRFIFFSDSFYTKLHISIWDTRVHGIPQTRSTLSIVEQGCRAKDTIQARNDISWYVLVFISSILKNSIQAKDGRHSKVGLGSCKFSCLSYTNHRRLSTKVIWFIDSRSKIDPRYHRRNIAYNYVSQTRLQCYTKFKFFVRQNMRGGI